MRTKSQTGSSLVAALLVLVAIALVAFVGFYIYNANKNTNKVISEAASSQKSTPSVAAQQYLTIKELGIKIPLNNTLAGLEYSMAPTDNTIADLSTKAFEHAVGECRAADTASASFPAIGEVTKIAGTYDSSKPPQDVFSSFVAQFPTYYLTFGAPDGGYCTGTNQAKNAAVKALFDKVSPALKTAVQNAKQV